MNSWLALRILHVFTRPGSVAPSVDTLKSKYKTADELVAGAKNVKNPMMQAVQADEAKLKAAAAEIVK